MNILGFWHHQIVFVRDTEGTLGFLDNPMERGCEDSSMFLFL